MAEKEIVNLEDFLTIDNEEKGKWFEPKINGVPCGIEFQVTGKNTDKNVVSSERYEKESAEAEEIKDNIERIRRKKILDANRVAEFVVGIRPAEGKQIMYGGKPLVYSVELIQQLLLKSPLIKAAIVEYAIDPTNFIGREKNA